MADVLRQARRSQVAEDNYAIAKALLVNAIRPALQTLNRGGRAAEQLLLGTAIQESLLVHRRQMGGGPARGLFQMEPATHDDCWTNYLEYRAALAAQIKETLEAGQEAAADTLETNDRYAAAMCRVRYMRVPERLPAAGDIEAMANYWKAHYNTALGAGRPEEYLEKWARYVDNETFA